MSPALPIVVLSGAGLSAASGVPTFRDKDGLWEGHDIQDIATPGAWRRDAELVRRFYDERRLAAATVQPNPGHLALARLQREVPGVTMITQNIDGLLGRAGCPDVIEMHGSLWHLRCERSEAHPWEPVTAAQPADARCACGGLLRPAVVWFGEMPIALDRIYAAVTRCKTFVSVGTSGLVYPAAGLAAEARAAGAHCIEVNPRPVGGPFHEVIAEGSEVALPRLVGQWLDR
jgi:NAD-dependent deacetylase